MSDVEMPFYARQIHTEVLGCRGNDRLAVILTGEGNLRTWTMAQRDMGGRFNPVHGAKRHSFSAALPLFDHGLVRIERGRLIPIVP